ncbi:MULTISPECIES: response regulator transcription factor [unclassified Pedobacter]|uniref:response regulator transcription factor n=1 Tax=unclassified Pedobacter TaxID=2628915 RepID=UPI001420295A|nr:MULTISPECIES: response regulator transcription factor [unclassified Pedobacter]NII82007.1 DNA-binding response OmpR family regulator [Pedobacter sp. SG908]NMN36011.1 DNA-binding response OmpR family regulator [Pedobacter sp. SG918]
MPKIGIAEDDPKISELLKSALEENDYQVLTVANGTDALELFLGQNFNLFIIDVMMPGLNGIQLCKHIRKNTVQTPILMLTAMGTIDDKVTGLEAGADDYLVKPFHLKELLARVAALLRRQPTVTTQTDSKLYFEDLVLDTYSKEVSRGGKTIELSAKEFILLELFMHNPNRLLSRQFIAEQAWDISFETGTNVIDVYINFLRKKIEKGFERKLIHTKINMGYILK